MLEIIYKEIQEGDRVVIKGLFGLQDRDEGREERATYTDKVEMRKGEQL